MYHDMNWLWGSVAMIVWLAIFLVLIYAVVRLAINHERDGDRPLQPK